jgi:hypothetical protein
MSADTSPLNEVCPNDGQLMRPLTWREANQEFSAECYRLRQQLNEATDLLIENWNGYVDDLPPWRARVEAYLKKVGRWSESEGKPK